MLALAVLCALLIARVGGIPVGGTAVAPPGLSAPAVGDCLLAVRGELGSGEPPAAPVGSIGESEVSFSDCAGEHLGEVVAYRRLPTQAVADDGTASDIQWCGTVALEYQEHARSQVSAAAGGFWSATTGERFAAILSTPNSDVAEPRWSACALVSPDLELYSGSYVSSFATGVTPAPFGVCRAGDVPERSVSCDLPHRVQEFGTGTVPPMSTRDAVAACRSLIGRKTGMSDITAGGLLRTEVVGGGADATEPASCRLSVAGDDRLVGTLIGIAGRPLPMA